MEIYNDVGFGFISVKVVNRSLVSSWCVMYVHIHPCKVGKHICNSCLLTLRLLIHFQRWFPAWEVLCSTMQKPQLQYFLLFVFNLVAH